MWNAFGTFIVYFLYAWIAGHNAGPAHAIRAAELLDFTEIRVVNKSIIFMELRGCGLADDARFTLKARTPQGNEKTFYACSSWLFQGSGTIRAI